MSANKLRLELMIKLLRDIIYKSLIKLEVEFDNIGTEEGLDKSSIESMQSGARIISESILQVLNMKEENFSVLFNQVLKVEDSDLQRRAKSPLL